MNLLLQLKIENIAHAARRMKMDECKSSNDKAKCAILRCGSLIAQGERKKINVKNN